VVKAPGHFTTEKEGNHNAKVRTTVILLPAQRKRVFVRLTKASLGEEKRTKSHQTGRVGGRTIPD